MPRFIPELFMTFSTLIRPVLYKKLKDGKLFGNKTFENLFHDNIENIFV